MTLLLSELSWPAVNTLPRDTPVVLPIAALEQHGPHLPLFTDSFLVGEVARRANEALGDRVLFAPVMWLGNSHHHLDSAGTMTAAPRVYLDMLRTMADCVLAHGFNRIVLLNGHGGNNVPGQQVLYELRQSHRDRKDLLLLLANYWALGSDPAQCIPGLKHRIEHACQWETSMMLRLRPDLVGDFRSVAKAEWGNPFQPASRAWTMPDVSAEGHVGEPALASAEIGEALFQTFAADAVAFLQRVLDWNGRSWNG